MNLTRDMILALRQSRIQEMQTLRQQLQDIREEYRQATTDQEQIVAINKRIRKKQEIQQSQAVNECLRELVRAFQMAARQ